MNRPKGVTLLGALLLSASVFLLVLTAVSYQHPEILLKYQIVRLQRSETLTEAAGLFLLVAPITGCILGVIGIGLLLLRSWARWAMLLTTGIGLARIMMAVAAGFLLAHDRFVLTPAQTIPIIFNATVVFYLTRPAVRAAFGEGSDARIYSK